MKLRIVLVEPQEAGNVGAAARAMKNFGFTDLWIVGRHPELHPLGWWWASGADDVIENATFVPTLFDALRNAQLTVATTSSRGRTTPADFTPATLGERFGAMTDDQTLALVFGREDSGLTREELLLCQRTAVIPTSPAFPTMNLAQSVGIFSYALSQVVPAPRPRELPDAALIERLHERAQSFLLEIEFLRGTNPDHIYDDLRAMAGRAELDVREVTILLGIIRQLEWKLRQ